MENNPFCNLIEQVRYTAIYCTAHSNQLRDGRCVEWI